MYLSAFICPEYSGSAAAGSVPASQKQVPLYFDDTASKIQGHKGHGEGTENTEKCVNSLIKYTH